MSTKNLARSATAVALAVLLAAPALAGHGAVEYENPLRSAQEKKRASQPAAAPAPATAPAAVVAPAPAGSPAAAPNVARDHEFAAALRSQLAQVVASSEARLAGGKDGPLDKAARRTLESARKEIAELDRWLAANPEAPAE